MEKLYGSLSFLACSAMMAPFLAAAYYIAFYS